MTELVHSNELCFSDRMQRFLASCKNKYKNGYANEEAYPNFKKLAELCNCNQSTISRIASGETQSFSGGIVDICSAIAGIQPPANLNEEYGSEEEIQERSLRVRDAAEATNKKGYFTTDVLDAIMAGISARRVEVAATSPKVQAMSDDDILAAD